MTAQTPARFNITKLLLQLNGLAVIAAVIHHAIHWVLTGMFFWADRYKDVVAPDLSQLGSPQYYLIRLMDQPSTVAVPAFLFVSGYFIAFVADRNSDKVGWKYIVTRIKFLIIPYLIWCSVYLVFNFIQGKQIAWYEAVRLIITGGISAPFYYVILVLQLYIISPLITPLMRKHWRTLLTIAVLIQLPGIYYKYSLFIVQGYQVPPLARAIFLEWYLPAYFLWFLLGIFAGMHISLLKGFLEKSRRWLPYAVFGVMILGIIEWNLIRQASGRTWISPQETILDRVFTFFMLLWFFSAQRIENWLPARLRSFGIKSYGIYLIHPLVLEIAARLTYHFAPKLMAYPLLFLMFLTIVGVGAPILLMATIERSPARRFYKLLFGG
jgi:surface polysaccharide O-acyltransferase-like enzyme